MSKPSGVIVFFDESQRAELIQARANTSHQSFSDALSVPDWKLRGLEIGLLAFSESTIDYIALLKRGKRVTTAKYRVEFSELVSLGAIQIQDIETKLRQQIRPYFIRSSRGRGGTIPVETWNQVIAIIKDLRPKKSTEIDRLMTLREYTGFRFIGALSEVLLQEREALGVALDIFSGSNELREKVLGGWAPAKEYVKNRNEELMQAELVPQKEDHWAFTKFISKNYSLNEESALQHDLFNWPDMSTQHQAGSSIFRQGTRTLEVFYANRNTLERTLGVDLIYYNNEYESFALVQYKLMKEETEDDRMVYRPDPNIHKELQRMDDFIKRYGLDCELESHKDFRLSADGFFVKLVPNRGLRPASGELIKGMYITRDYMKFLLGPKGPKGKRGGSVIDFDNAPRYLANSDFIQVVSCGWVGMRRLHVDALKDLIQQHYESERALLLAYERDSNVALQAPFRT